MYYVVLLYNKYDQENMPINAQNLANAILQKNAQKGFIVQKCCESGLFSSDPDPRIRF